MVNYKTYKIIGKVESRPIFNYIMFELKDYADHPKGHKVMGWVYCRNHYPYNNYKEGDWLEIDLDRIGDKNDVNIFDDTSIVRKLGEVVSSSSTNVITTRGSSSNIVISPSAVNYMKSPEAMEMAHRMSRMVDETGKNWEYKIEVENKDGKKISHSLICRKD